MYKSLGNVVTQGIEKPRYGQDPRRENEVVECI